MNEKPIVGITMGDPAGNGPEITVKALAHEDLYDRCRPIVVGDAKMLEQAARFVGRPISGSTGVKPCPTPCSHRGPSTCSIWS